MSSDEAYETALKGAVSKYRQDLAHVGILLTTEEAEKRFKSLSTLKPDGLGFCRLTDDRPRKYKAVYKLCTDHNMPATHVGTDGDTPVCGAHAQSYGCNCCRVNFDPKLRQMLLSDALPYGTLLPLVDRRGDTARVVGQVEVYIDDEGLKIEGNIIDEQILKALRPNSMKFSLSTDFNQD